MSNDTHTATLRTSLQQRARQVHEQLEPCVRIVIAMHVACARKCMETVRDAELRYAHQTFEHSSRIFMWHTSHAKIAQRAHIVAAHPNATQIGRSSSNTGNGATTGIGNATPTDGTDDAAEW
jgi:hypothetical protein